MSCNAQIKIYLSVGFFVTLFILVSSNIGSACEPQEFKRETTAPTEIIDYFKDQRKIVLTILGYSAADYEDKAAMIEQASQILDRADPETTIVNIGATPDGIGAVYNLAKEKGFTTSGIVSTQFWKSNAIISSCVDVVFFVEDEEWGGFLEGTKRLSPTSTTMVEVSDRLVAIGGGDVTRDELIAAKQAGKSITFIAADMNHAIARERALKRGHAEPTDFRGTADTTFGRAKSQK